MTRYRCQECGETVEAPRKPDHCPCGSEDIEELEDEEFMDRIKDSIGL